MLLDVPCSNRKSFNVFIVFAKIILGLPEFGVMGIANGILTIYTPYV